MMDLALAIKNARLQAIADAVDAEGAGATFTVYTGPRPADVAQAATGDTLVTLEIPAPFAESLDNGVLTGKPMAETLASGNGEAGWGRIRAAGGTAVMDLDVGADGSGAPATLPSTQIYAGMLIEGVSVVLAEP